MVWAESTSPVEILSHAERLGIQARVENILDDAKSIFVMRMVLVETGTKVDVSLAYSGFEREAIDRSIIANVESGHVRILDVEDLIIMKAVAQRPRDINDIALLAETFPDLDEKRVKRWVVEFGEVLDQPDLWAKTKSILDQARRR